MDNLELDCSVSIESVRPAGSLSSSSQKANKCTIALGRNQFRDVVVRITSHCNKANCSQEINMKEVQIFRKYLRDGKATIRTSDTQLLVSNCPPERLSVFLKVLAIKLGIKKSHTSDRTKLYSSLRKQFEHISPLTAKDCHSYNDMNKQVCTNKPDVTPKRKRVCDGAIELPRKRLNCANTELKKSDPKPTISWKTKSTLNKKQSVVLQSVLGGSNVFITGSAGTGKSFLLKKIVGSLPPRSTVVSASTGIAASHVGGITLHSFAGIGDGNASLENCFKLASRPSVKQQWQKCQHLVIDEISMVNPSYFDKLEAVACFMKKCNKPFGGIQLILCGDFLQLPPVSRGATEKKKFCFQSEAWKKCINSVFELTDIKRQEDADFINILQHVRVGKCPRQVFEELRNSSERLIERHGIQATRLCTHKDDVEQMNSLSLKNLKGETKLFVSVDSDWSLSDQMDKFLPVMQKLELKVGAQVMLTKNLDLKRGLVNGARGVIRSFKSDSSNTPVVKFINGVELSIKTERFVMKTPGGGFAVRSQLPLKLAWAISIHKSQGLTLDCIEVSLARVFEDGQAYVALSRAKNFSGLRVIDLKEDSFRAHPDALKYYIKVRREIRLNNNYQ